MKYSAASPILLFCALSAGCGTVVADPHQTDLWHYNAEATQKYLQEKQDALDDLNRRSQQIRLETEQARRNLEATRTKNGALQAQIAECDADIGRIEKALEETTAISNAQAGKLQEIKRKTRQLKMQIEDVKKRGNEPGQEEELRKELEALRARNAQLNEEVRLHIELN